MKKELWVYYDGDGLVCHHWAKNVREHLKLNGFSGNLKNAIKLGIVAKYVKVNK